MPASPDVRTITTTELLPLVSNLEVDRVEALKAKTAASHTLAARDRDYAKAEADWRTAATELRKRLARDLDA